MALQKLCLDVIASSIDRHNHVFSTTQDEDTRWRFQRLQMDFSCDILERLIEKRLLQEKYADLLFNKYLTSINTGWFSGFSWKSITEIFARIGPGLKEAYFSECYDTSRPWKDIMCYLPNIKKISYIMRCNDSILQSIAEHCPKLEILYVSYSVDVTSSGLAHFCQRKNSEKTKRHKAFFNRRAAEKELPCPLLKEVYINYASVQDDGIQLLLKKSPSLEKIGHPRLPVVLCRKHIRDLGTFSKAERYNLTHLDLLPASRHHTDFYSDILKVCFTVCPNLKSVSCKILKLEHLNLCLLLSSVENLILDCGDDARFDVSNFLTEKGGKLTSLDLRRCIVSLRALGLYCHGLKQLTLCKVTIQYDAQEDISVFDNLKTLIVNQVDFSKSSNCKGICRILQSSLALECLDFTSCETFPTEIIEAILKSCEQCPLKHIEFTGPSVALEFLKDILAKCSTLEILNLLFCFGNASTEIEEELYRIANLVPNKPKVSVK